MSSNRPRRSNRSGALVVIAAILVTSCSSGSSGLTLKSTCIDYLNADDVRRTLVPHEERQIGTQQVAIDRSITDSGRFVVKEIRLADTGRSVIERVRLFAPIELEALVSAAGLTVTHRFGGYGGDGQTEPGDRVILVAKKR